MTQVGNKKLKYLKLGLIAAAGLCAAVSLPSSAGERLLAAAPSNVDYRAQFADSPTPLPTLQRLRFDTSVELERELAALDYEWPPRAGVPIVAVDTLPTDLASLPVARKKALFFRSLLPLVLAENRKLLEQRKFLQSAFARLPQLAAVETDRLREIQATYRIRGDITLAQTQADLLRRADVIPPALVLAQAANESGWGTSRFAREANNLFGMWTYNPALGLVPKQRNAGARHRVRAYDDLRASVRHYMLTLNRVGAYAELREMRAAQRAAGRRLDAGELAQGLLAYSERGAAYVEEIRSMIRSNRLQELGGLSLSAS